MSRHHLRCSVLLVSSCLQPFLRSEALLDRHYIPLKVGSHVGHEVLVCFHPCHVLGDDVLRRAVEGSHWSLGSPFPSCSDLHFRFFSTAVISSASFEISFTRFAGRQVPSSSTFAAAFVSTPALILSAEWTVFESVSMSMSSAFENVPSTAGSAGSCVLSFSKSKCALSPLFPTKRSLKQLAPPLLSLCTSPDAPNSPATPPAAPGLVLVLSSWFHPARLHRLPRRKMSRKSELSMKPVSSCPS